MVSGILAFAAGCVNDSPTKLHSRIKIDRSRDDTPGLAAAAATAGDNSRTPAQGQGVAIGPGGAIVGGGAGGATGVNQPITGGGAIASGVAVNAVPGAIQSNPSGTSEIVTSSGASIGTGVSGSGTGSGSSAGATSTAGNSALIGIGTRTGTAGTGNTSITGIGTTGTTTTSGLTGSTTSSGITGSSSLGTASSLTLTPGLGSINSSTSSFLTQTNLNTFSTNLFGPH